MSPASSQLLVAIIQHATADKLVFPTVHKWEIPMICWGPIPEIEDEPMHGPGGGGGQ